MAFELSVGLAPQSTALVAALVIDGAVGDPVYRAHPVRLIGRALQRVEAALGRLGATGYLGGVALFVMLATTWVGGLSIAVVLAQKTSAWLGWGLHLFVLYSFLALGDLLAHGWRVERRLRQGDLASARTALACLVGRDTDGMDAGACRRATIESLGENLTDGFTSPLFWYVVAGLPGLVLFKVVSTMDSMVGYRTPRYLRFGWCGARLDDLMNFLPARLTWLLVSIAATVVPGCSARRALRVGWQQHALVPGPNAGWSEAAIAGAIQGRLVGPIRMNGRQVADLWLGDPGDPPAGTSRDFMRAVSVIVAAGALASASAWGGGGIGGLPRGAIACRPRGRRRILRTGCWPLWATRTGSDWPGSSSASRSTASTSSATPAGSIDMSIFRRAASRRFSRRRRPGKASASRRSATKG
jgi:adenosylcobinamide-phosphate synthase